jgi:hypothetical protein
VTEPDPKERRTLRGRFAHWLDCHATVLTIVCVAVLVLVPTKIAYDASGDATDAGETATSAARKATNAVLRLEDERRARIYDQNGIDRYFCGKAGAIEKVLTLLVGAALSSHQVSELSTAQLQAREVFEGVLDELHDAPKCEVLIPAPPKPKAGESRKSAQQREGQAANHPGATPQFEGSGATQPSGPSSSPSHEATRGGSGAAGGHQAPSGGVSPSGGGGGAPEGAQGAPQGAAPPESTPSQPSSGGATGTTTEASPPGETPVASEPPTEAPAAPAATGVLGTVQEQVGTTVGGLVEGVCTTVEQLAGLCH